MGKIYGGIIGLEVPQYNTSLSWEANREAEDRYVKEIVNYCKIFGKGPDRGRIVSFPVADGYAQYAIVSLSPVELIHLAFGDAYHFQYIERLTAKDIRARLGQAKALAEIFG